ncbi:hypothetical protein [Stenotrophomonas sp. S11A1a]|uniref:hypothetical protein n=1 Tax=Stenotrophomonas sp. S11A1a TaxID=3455011 RepID=UPI003F79F5FC
MKPSACALTSVGAARTQAYHHIEAGFTRGSEAGAALAVADDGDLGLGQVIGAHGGGSLRWEERTAGRRGDVPAGQGKAMEEAPCVAQAQAQAQAPQGVVVVLVQVLKLALFMVVRLKPGPEMKKTRTWAGAGF